MVESLLSPSIVTGIRRRIGIQGAPLLSAVFVFVVYILRSARSLTVLGDSAIFVSAAAQAGVPQPSGYPLYTLLGRLAASIPLGSIPARVNALSAVCHAGAVGFMAATIQVVTGSPVAALCGALFIGCSRAFLLGSLYAEAFPLNDLLTAALMYFACGFGPNTEGRRFSGFRACAVCMGLGASHHQMLTLSLPGALVLVAGSQGDTIGKRLLALARGALRWPLWVLFLGIPVFSYGLQFALARRDPAQNWGDLGSLGEVFRLVTRADYGGLFSPHLGAPQTDAISELAAYSKNLWGSVGWLGCGLFAIGAYRLFRERRTQAFGFGMTALIAGPVFSVLNRLDVSNAAGLANAERFITMSLVALAPFAGAGVAQLEALGSRFLNEPVARACAGALAVLPLWFARDVNLRKHLRGADFSADLLLGVEDRSLVLTTGDAANSALVYRCGVELRCGRSITFSPGQLHFDWRVRQLKRRNPDLVLAAPAGAFLTTTELIQENIERRPVYVMAGLLQLEPRLQTAFDFLPAGLLLRVRPVSSAKDDTAMVFDSAKRLVESCRGCSPSGFRPALEWGVDLVYVQALLNHANLLQTYPAAGPLVRKLEGMAQKLDSKLY